MSLSMQENCRRRRVTIAAAAAALLAVSAPMARAAETQIQVGVTGQSLGFASWFLAEDGGIFAHNGIHANFVILSAAAVPAALLSGGIQGTPLTESVMHAQFAGYALRDVALLEERPVYEILAHKDIAAVKDLKGKTVIASPPKALPTLLFKYFLEEAGLNPEHDVKILAIGAIETRQTLMLSGQGAAIIESTRSALQLRDKLPQARILKSEAEMPVLLADGVGVSVALIDKDPDLVTRMVRSLARANAETRSHPEWAAALLAKRMKLPNAGKLLTDILIHAFSAHLTPTPAQYAAEAAFMSHASPTKVTVERVEASWDTRFAVAIDREMAKTAQ